MNLRRVAEAVQSGALDQSLDVEQVEQVRDRLAEIAAVLGRWMAGTFGIDAT